MSDMKKQRVAYDLSTEGRESEICGAPDLEEIHLQLQVCSKCAKKSQKKGDFDPMTALRELCVDVQPHKCFKQCKRGPNARLVQAGSQRGIMVDGMSEKELKDRSFHEIKSQTAADRVAKLIKGVTGAQIQRSLESSESDSSSDS